MPKGSSAPIRPRSTRLSARKAIARQPNRGGIQKRGSTPLRVDRDGDLDMGTADANNRNGRARRSGRGSAIRGTVLSQRQQTRDTSSTRLRPPRNGIDISAVQKAVLRQVGSNEPIPKASRRRPRDSVREAREGHERLRIFGLRESKAASNPDGGLSDLTAFLERKATHGNEEAVKIKKSHLEGDNLVIYVNPADAPKILRINDFSFAGAKLKIEAYSANGILSSNQTDSETPDTMEVLKDFLSRRYKPETKLLDLSNIRNEPELVNIGMFDTPSRESKFFPALMRICDKVFTSAEEKEEAVASVSLANNALPNIAAVTALSQTFPNLKNLDLSNNEISDLKSLEGWQWRFAKLHHLVLSGNPIQRNEPDLNQKLMKWYPNLTTLSSIQVRSHDEAQTTKSNKLPLPILAPSFRDEFSVGEHFVKQYFLGFDSDRAALVNGCYDAQSTFSLSVNTSALRKTEISSLHPPPKWVHYIKKSRNLSKVTSLSAKKDRLYTGTNAIRDCFNTLPPTKHADLFQEPQRWCIECNALPCSPDLSGQSASVVGGLMITTHGEFLELDAGSNIGIATRSFDRTFVLGPGGGIGGIRVVCDTLVLRAYGGFDAWQPEDREATLTTAGPTRPAIKLHIPAPPDFGVIGPGKTDEQVQKEALALELSKATGMTLEYSGMCLEQSGWILKEAGVIYEQAKANLPPEAYV